MAGFEVIIYGRFWVITEANHPLNRPIAAHFDLWKILRVASADQAISSPTGYSEMEREFQFSFAPQQRTVGFQVSEAVMRVTLAATRHCSLSNGRSTLKLGL
jgi:hypothetical protein